jgi:hypothetical protein
MSHSHSVIERAKKSIQRMVASRSGLWQFDGLLRLAPTADAGRYAAQRLFPVTAD